MISKQIEKISSLNNLSFNEAYDTLNKIMKGEVNQTQITALLIALKTKGETPEEVAGFAKSMQDNCIRINNHTDAIDLCGTGGDKSGTFNISTATSFIVAAAGIKVAKHGNRSISSKSGSADVLTELGININLSPAQSEQALSEIGITFLFAPNHHPSMKYVMPVRNELKTKTIFNILGPLTNPALVKKQLIGTFNNSTAEIMAKASGFLNQEKTIFVCTDNKYDEVLLTGKTILYEFQKNKSLSKKIISHNDFDYPEIGLQQIQGSTAKENARIIIETFSNKKKTAQFYTIAANAAIVFYTLGIKNTLLEAKTLAEDLMLSGEALTKINQLKIFGENIVVS